MDNDNNFTRRDFIKTGVIGLAAIQLQDSSFAQTNPNTRKVKAIVFDGFVIFNSAPVFRLADDLFKEKSSELCKLWRTKQFEYTWLRTAANKYKDFWQVTEDALIFASKQAGVSLAADQKQQLMDAYLELEVWPDVKDGLIKLKELGFSLSFLSNFTVSMLTSSLRHNHLEPYFDHLLSTDQVGFFKPGPSAYQMGIRATGLKKEEILFAAFGGWDAAGAKLFGYPTYWVNRANTVTEELGVQPDGVGKTLTDLIKFVNT
ncbi:MAG: haloacid dehalogenase type II [Bacteroidetes bacterium]|jgi:2-haloacid dehalogenase|nr:haloacid dehalogenase type II [Bacteroidota bacterium]